MPVHTLIYTRPKKSGLMAGSLSGVPLAELPAVVAVVAAARARGVSEAAVAARMHGVATQLLVWMIAAMGPEMSSEPAAERRGAAPQPLPPWLVLARIFVFWTPAPGRRYFRYSRHLRIVPGCRKNTL